MSIVKYMNQSKNFYFLNFEIKCAIEQEMEYTINRITTTNRMCIAFVIAEINLSKTVALPNIGLNKS